jgi:RNA polymerase sigma-70 factor (ECF subfamily)
VVQEAAIIAMNKLGEFDSSTSFAAWMSQIVRYVALNEGRKLQRRRPGAPEEALATLPADAVPAPRAAFDERVNAALTHLEERARTCLILRVVHGMSHAEIAATLGIPEGTVMSHVHRAKSALRRSLAPQTGGDA